MRDKQNLRVIDQLKAAAKSADVQTFSETLLRVLILDADAWLRTVRVQRLVERFRSVDAIRKLRSVLSTKLVAVQIGSSTHEKLLQHIDVCEFMQHVFADIDRQAELAQPSSASQEAVYWAVLRAVEVAHWAMQENAFRLASRSPNSPPDPLQLAAWDRRLRDLMDVSLTILNSSPGRTGKAGGSVTDSELNRLFELAFLFEEMRLSIDLYTYQGAVARIKRKAIVFKHSDPEADAARAVGAERARDHDRTRQALLLNFEVELRKVLGLGPKDETFVRFLNKNAALSRSATQFIRARSGDYSDEISEYFDIESVVCTRSGSFLIQEFIRAWAVFAFVSVAGQEWNRRKTETEFRADPIVELPRGYMTLILSRQLKISHRQARAILRQFTTVLGLGRTDLFYKPLVQVDRRRLIIPTPFVLSSRFDRNIFAIIVTESELDQKKKGFLPIRSLAEEFKIAGFLSIIDYKVRSNGRVVTDIDIVAFKGGFLFLGQAKIVIEPDSSYDQWKAEEKMRDAATQLRCCVEHLDEVKSDLMKRLSTDECIAKVVPFIVTNTRQFTERRFDGYPVVDVPYLSFLLNGATGTVIQTESGRRPRLSSWKSFINGKYPTEIELDTLIHATIHHVRDRGMVYKHELRTIGDRKIHLPMVRLKSPGLNKMAFVDDEPEAYVRSPFEK
jgi:hypothetical protein